MRNIFIKIDLVIYNSGRSVGIYNVYFILDSTTEATTFVHDVYLTVLTAKIVHVQESVSRYIMMR